MKLVAHPVGQNVRYLRQGVALVRRLDDEAYRRSPGGPFRGGVGSQLRHCIDFYGCFLRGLDDGRIDYNSRDRDSRVEVDRRHAEQALDRLTDQLGRLEPSQFDRALKVRGDAHDPARPETGWSGSTVHSELQFLLSHTNHHYALIVALLARQGLDLGSEFAEFGVAPSTLHYWDEIGQAAD